MNRFTIPRDVYFGDDALDYLKSVEAKKAVIVYGSERNVEVGTIAKIEANLNEAGVTCVKLGGMHSDPATKLVENGLKVMNEEKPDLIVALGGGSPVDAAKAMWVFYEHPELTFEDAFKPFTLPALRQKAKFIAIGTTSGTGTEVTSFSVITDSASKIKYPIADFNVTPDVALLDTTLVEMMPARLVANTGMDALTHAIEAYTSTVATPYTDALAIKAIEMIDEYLLASFKGDMNARKQMHIAQDLAGMAFSNAILGIVHSMAHKTGALFGVPHGLMNAIYLPHATRFNAKTAPARYADIAKRLHLEGNSEAELIDSLVAYVNKFQKDMEMPMSLKDAGVDESNFKENLDFISKEAVGDPCTGTNPREISVDEMKKLFEIAYYNDKKVEF